MMHIFTQLGSIDFQMSESLSRIMLDVQFKKNTSVSIFEFSEISLSDPLAQCSEAFLQRVRMLKQFDIETARQEQL